MSIKSLFIGTIDSVIADVEKRVNKLELLAEARKVEAKLHQKEIEVRTELKAFAEKEAARATVVASKFRDLISAF